MDDQAVHRVNNDHREQTNGALKFADPIACLTSAEYETADWNRALTKKSTPSRCGSLQIDLFDLLRHKRCFLRALQQERGEAYNGHGRGNKVNNLQRSVAYKTVSRILLLSYSICRIIRITSHKLQPLLPAI